MTDVQTLTTQLNITTLNVNGLHDDAKRQKTYKMLINRKIDIAFSNLQLINIYAPTNPGQRKPF